MGAATAAIIIKREKDLVEHFRRAAATNPQAAQSSDALGVEENLVWRRLVSSAVIRPGAAGTYYLDEPSWEATGRRRRRLAIVALVVAAALGLLLYLAGMSATR
jgi:hypothetical protein